MRLEKVRSVLGTIAEAKPSGPTCSDGDCFPNFSVRYCNQSSSASDAMCAVEQSRDAQILDEARLKSISRSIRDFVPRLAADDDQSQATQ